MPVPCPGTSGMRGYGRGRRRRGGKGGVSKPVHLLPVLLSRPEQKDRLGAFKCLTHLLQDSFIYSFFSKAAKTSAGLFLTPVITSPF